MRAQQIYGGALGAFIRSTRAIAFFAKNRATQQLLLRKGVGMPSAKHFLAILTSLLVSSSTVFAAPTNMSASQVLTDECQTLPGNLSVSAYWDSKMDILGPWWCDYPSIIPDNQSQGDTINGADKPMGFADGSSALYHDVHAVEILNGSGVGSTALGIAPYTPVSYGLYCSNTSDLQNARPGDVAFSLRAYSNSCGLLNPSLPTIPVFGGVQGNSNAFIGDQKFAHGLHVSSGGNYGLAVDYYTPGGANTVLGGGNVSFALPEFAGIILAINTVLIDEGKQPLNNSNVREVLDASSDEIYLEVNGARGVYKESQLNGLSGYKYYGQIVNLTNAIEYALTGIITPPPPPPPPPPTIGQIAATLIPVYALLFDE